MLKQIKLAQTKSVKGKCKTSIVKKPAKRLLYT